MHNQLYTCKYTPSRSSITPWYHVGDSKRIELKLDKIMGNVCGAAASTHFIIIFIFRDMLLMYLFDLGHSEFLRHL